MTGPTQSTADSVISLLAGADATTRILAVEPVGGSRVAVYRRDPDTVMEREIVPFRPWLLGTRPEFWQEIRPAVTVEHLDGDHPLRVLVFFQTWIAFQEAVRIGRERRETFFAVNSYVDQYLILSGRTLFKGMVFEDLHRLQLDIETTGLDPRDSDNRVILVALHTHDGRERVLTSPSEATLLVELNQAIAEFDPDVIEGHNIFNFDLHVLFERAARLKVELTWGRDRSAPRIGQRRQRFKAGPLSLPFRPAFVHGRHIIDTYQQIQRYDAGGLLTSYGLKSSVEALGLTRTDREFIPGDQVRSVWQSDPDRLIRYALDDVRDVDVLSRLALPAEFYQTQLLPRSFQQAATTGPGTKINDLMLRAYLHRRASVPLPAAAHDYPGGYAELLQTGVFSPVVKCDVESLYPSIMLAGGITSARDTLGAYLPMLAELTRRRLHAKSMSRTTTGQEQAMWAGMQGAFKVLINSFYGYLGFGSGLFNDFDAAGGVTRAGQRLIKTIVAALQATGSIPIEVDTDGVYFVPPPAIATAPEELEYVERIASNLPPGIRLAHDGRFQSMLSLRLKNYALLGYDGRLTMKGSALRSRRLEPCFRDFLIAASTAFVTNRPEDARNAYFSLAERIKARRFDIDEIGQWAMVHDDTIAAQPRFKRLIERMPHTIRDGERIRIYERQDGELATIDEYDGDANIAYLLRRLSDTTGRFESLFPSKKECAAFFPSLSPHTDIDSAKRQEVSTQLSLF